MIWFLLGIVAIVLMIKPVLFVIFLIGKFWKAILFYIACVASNILYYVLGLDQMFPVSTFGKVACWVCVIVIPFWWAGRKASQKKE